jgi:ribosomal protein L11 methyltransferase
VEWAVAWKRVLVPVEISPRLVVAPSFATPAPLPGQRWLRIEPGQAFGTGAHHSTRLALEAIDLAVGRAPPRWVLDVGTGSGVLALAALSLGAQRALGFDLDPLAAPAARRAANENGLADRAHWFTGPIAALRPARFELVVANLLRRELLPIADEIAARVAAGAGLVLAGLLEADAPAVLRAFAPHGLQEVSRRVRRDDDDEAWLGLVLRRA